MKWKGGSANLKPLMSQNCTPSSSVQNCSPEFFFYRLTKEPPKH